MPAGATLVASSVSEPFENSDDYFRHILTYGGHPVACAVAVENIRILREEALDTAAIRSGAQLLRKLQEALEGQPFVGSIRGMGLLAGIELVGDPNSHTAVTPGTAQAVATELVRHGVITRVDTRGQPIIQVAPPLTSSDEDMDEIVAGLLAALRSVSSST
jgi:hypothetical protein